ncbi:MAG: TIGR03943 family protein [Anaerolineae bacterium]|nr:TIGR03943 family protein [Anaerolineae bacterium]
MTTIPMPDEHHEHIHPHDDRRTTAQLWVKALLMIGLGVYFVHNIASGSITNYVNERFAWLSYVAAALFLLIGGFSAWHLARKRGREHGHEHDAHDHPDHVHEPISWRVLAILAVPLVLGTLIPSKPLGAEAISGGVSLSSAATVGAAQAFNVPPEQRNVLDWLRAFNNADYPSFDGQTANVIGFVYSEPSFAPDEFMVARFAISCCVADATAIGLPVHWANATDLQQGQWIEVKGAFKVSDFGGDPMPVIQAERIDQVAQPEHPYLYP